MNRRSFMKNAFLAGLGCTFLPNGLPFSGVSGKKKVIVLGIDGMDPHLTLQYSRQGLLPNLTRIAGKGRLSPLATSTPPQSPVAWSNVIVGASPKTHGIYDFIHRIPTSMKPYLSTSRIAASPDTLDLGDYKIPLDEGRTELLRQGKQGRRSGNTCPRGISRPPSSKCLPISPVKTAARIWSAALARPT